MADAVVCDSGPLIAFAKLDLLGLLDSMFDNVWIPAVVLEECCHDRSLPGARKILAFSDRDDVHVAVIEPDLKRTLGPTLGSWELAAITLAREQAALPLIDDRLARRVARKEGVRVLGTLGVLLRAKHRGFVETVRPLIDQLDDSGYHLSQELRSEVLRLAEE